MRATLKIEMDNAAFGNSPQYELARILKDLADRLEGVWKTGYSLRDYNGNKVGELKIIGKDEK